MGKLIYGPQERVIQMEDRTLTHLKMVIVSKLRRSESFLLSWKVPLDQGSGRDSVWLNPAIPVQFQFSGNRPCAVNRMWLERMMQSANGGELRIMDEPERTTTGSLETLVAGSAAD